MSTVVGNSTPGIDSVTIAAVTSELVVNGSLTIDSDLDHQGTVTHPRARQRPGVWDAGYTWKSNTNFSNLVNLLQSSGTSAEHPFTIRTGRDQCGGHDEQSLRQQAEPRLRRVSANGHVIRQSVRVRLWRRASTGPAPHTVTMDHITFDTCGQVAWFNAAPNGAGWSLTAVTFANTLATNPFSLNAAGPTGARIVDLSSFDKPPLLTGQGSIYTRNVFLSGWGNTSNSSKVGAVRRGAPIMAITC